MFGLPPEAAEGGQFVEETEESAAARTGRPRPRRGERRQGPPVDDVLAAVAEATTELLPSAPEEAVEAAVVEAQAEAPAAAFEEAEPAVVEPAPVAAVEPVVPVIDLRTYPSTARNERFGQPQGQQGRDQRQQPRNGQPQPQPQQPAPLAQPRERAEHRPVPSHQAGQRHRVTPLPVGVPSAAAFDEPEPQRTPVPPRAEPSGDLALLLRGFEDIQQKNTDRMLSALRQSLVNGEVGGVPRQQSATERVGVFLDVPNLVYAARYLTRYIDFGRLLERLVAGRRLVRAHAYSPTDPDPSAEQQFLSPVKGQGYRLTTKNYRTFASGAKKADMDLDLCMDVVRLVVARSVDCIILASGDGDFMPLVEFCSDYGVRVEVASFAEATSEELRQGCDRFYNLSAMEGIRLARPLANT